MTNRYTNKKKKKMVYIYICIYVYVRVYMYIYIYTRSLEVYFVIYTNKLLIIQSYNNS